jgi:hypothetical protein
MVVSPVGLETTNHCAGEGQLQSLCFKWLKRSHYAVGYFATLVGSQNGRKTDEWWTGKDSEGDGAGINELVSDIF